MDTPHGPYGSVQFRLSDVPTDELEAELARRQMVAVTKEPTVYVNGVEIDHSPHRIKETGSMFPDPPPGRPCMGLPFPPPRPKVRH